eukprot:TRINITY_DN112312_c0_g1_i1.p1 TRINITY_DN112312_c0_g1~~TRINITY_DN112312_c0_g1_i1.p1  ORF type:complete len:1201 (-),score=288.83 TRINITY_DN112312_c0_g1_i1:61-3663(-)
MAGRASHAAGDPGVCSARLGMLLLSAMLSVGFLLVGNWSLGRTAVSGGFSAAAAGLPSSDEERTASAWFGSAAGHCRVAAAKESGVGATAPIVIVMILWSRLSEGSKKRNIESWRCYAARHGYGFRMFSPDAASWPSVCTSQEPRFGRHCVFAEVIRDLLDRTCAGSPFGSKHAGAQWLFAVDEDTLVYDFSKKLEEQLPRGGQSFVFQESWSTGELLTSVFLVRISELAASLLARLAALKANFAALGANGDTGALLWLLLEALDVELPQLTWPTRATCLSLLQESRSQSSQTDAMQLPFYDRFVACVRLAFGKRREFESVILRRRGHGFAAEDVDSNIPGNKVPYGDRVFLLQGTSVTKDAFVFDQLFSGCTPMADGCIEPRACTKLDSKYGNGLAKHSEDLQLLATWPHCSRLGVGANDVAGCIGEGGCSTAALTDEEWRILQPALQLSAACTSPMAYAGRCTCEGEAAEGQPQPSPKDCPPTAAAPASQGATGEVDARIAKAVAAYKQQAESNMKQRFDAALAARTEQAVAEALASERKSQQAQQGSAQPAQPANKKMSEQAVALDIREREYEASLRSLFKTEAKLNVPPAEQLSPYFKEDPTTGFFKCNFDRGIKKKEMGADRWKLVGLARLVLQALAEAGMPAFVEGGNLLTLVRGCSSFEGDDIDFIVYHRFFNRPALDEAMARRDIKILYKFGQEDKPGFELSLIHNKFSGVKADVTFAQETTDGWWKSLWVHEKLVRCYQPGPAEYVLVESKEEYRFITNAKEAATSREPVQTMPIYFFMPANAEFWLTWAFGVFWTKKFTDVYPDNWHWYESRKWTRHFCNVTAGATVKHGRSHLPKDLRNWQRFSIWNGPLKRLDELFAKHKHLWDGVGFDDVDERMESHAFGARRRSSPGRKHPPQRARPIDESDDKEDDDEARTFVGGLMQSAGSYVEAAKDKLQGVFSSSGGQDYAMISDDTTCPEPRIDQYLGKMTVEECYSYCMKHPSCTHFTHYNNVACRRFNGCHESGRIFLVTKPSATYAVLSRKTPDGRRLLVDPVEVVVEDDQLLLVNSSDVGTSLAEPEALQNGSNETVQSMDNEAEEFSSAGGSQQETTAQEVLIRQLLDELHLRDLRLAEAEAKVAKERQRAEAADHEVQQCVVQRAFWQERALPAQTSSWTTVQPGTLEANEVPAFEDRAAAAAAGAATASDEAFV